MHKLLVSALLLAAAAAPASSAAPIVATVDLANFRFSPQTLQLRAGSPTVLRLRNQAGGGHNFSAPAFFAASKISGPAKGLIRDGRVEVPPRSTVDITLVPAAGEYRLKCTHQFHSMFGMKGRISVR